MAQNASIEKPTNLPPKPCGGKNGRIGAYLQALALQRVMFALAIDIEKEAGEQVSAAKAWVVLEEQKRILKGKPLPGSLRPEQAKPKRSKPSLSPLPQPLSQPVPESKLSSEPLPLPVPLTEHKESLE